MNRFDLLIMATERNIPTLKLMLPFCRENINAGNIYIVADSRLKEAVNAMGKYCFLDEAAVMPGLHLKSVSDIMEQISGERKRAGWYLQQFLKLAYAYKCTDKNYAVIDADTFPLNKIDFIDDDQRYLFTQKIEYHKPYFDTIQKLFGGKVKKRGNFSFVAEHMMFDCEIVREMLGRIMENSSIPGNTFYEKILNAIDPEYILSAGFSEFETYGNYMLTYHPNKLKMRKLRTQREAALLIGGSPTLKQLEWAKRDYDMISIEGGESTVTIVSRISGNEFVMRLVHMNTLAKIRGTARSIYRKVHGKQDFTLEEN